MREQEVAALREIAEAAAELQSQDVQGAKVIEMSKKVGLSDSQLKQSSHVSAQYNPQPLSTTVLIQNT